jgi:hypothetical protein
MWHRIGIRGQSSLNSSQFILMKLSTFFMFKFHISLLRRIGLVIPVTAKNAVGSPCIPVRLCSRKSRLSGTDPMLSDRSFADRLLEIKPSNLNECAHATSVSNTDTDPINFGKNKTVFWTDSLIKEVIKHNIQFPWVTAKIVVKQCVGYDDRNR